MKTSRTSALPILFLAALGWAACASPEAADAGGKSATLRVAVFNIWELRRAKLDQVDEAGRGSHPQLRGAAEIVQRVRPDVLLVNEIDFDDVGENARLFVDRYLKTAQQPSLEGIDYPYVFVAPVNTGVPSGLDLDRNGAIGDPEDAYGFGHYPGEYGMALLSRLPIDAEHVRTFRRLLWRDVPGNLMPDDTGGKPAWYGPEEAAVLRLSSKSHWDVPVDAGGRTLHVLAAHPTPSVFDGDEDRNGRRNFDEIRLWADYLSGGEAASYLVDDEGRRGGLPQDASFVILGDMNADPYTDEGAYGRPAVSQLLAHPRVRDPAPRAPGGVGETGSYGGPKDQRTAPWGRLDYALPSRDLEVRLAGIFWPAPDDPLHRLVADETAASDHRLVWVDVAFP